MTPRRCSGLILRDGGRLLDPGFESLVLQHLADTVEALGHPEEADAHRQRASVLLGNHEDTFISLQARGKLLQQERRDAEAYKVFEQGLALVPAVEKAVQVTFMGHLALSSFNAGLLSDSLCWAKAVVEADPHARLSDSMRRLTASAWRSLGRLDEAEHELRLAIELASSANNRSQALALLAGVELAKGDLAAAERNAREAETLDPGKNGVPWIVLSQVEAMRGRFDEAIAAHERAAAIEHSHRPSQNRFVGASMQREIAGLQAQAGRLDLALELIRESEPEQARDRKHKVLHDAMAAFVHALRQDRAAAMACIASAEAGREAVVQDVKAQRTVLLELGRAALEIDETEQAETFFRSCLASDPSPVSLPMIRYYLASCRRRLGDAEGGRQCDRLAASSSFGTLHERLARERLDADAASAPEHKTSHPRIEA